LNLPQYRRDEADETGSSGIDRGPVRTKADKTGPERLSIVSRRARNIVIGKKVSRTLFFEPSATNSVGKKLDFEHFDVNRAPVQAVDSLRKVASAK
jgi:hypothetical protein